MRIRPFGQAFYYAESASYFCGGGGLTFWSASFPFYYVPLISIHKKMVCAPPRTDPSQRYHDWTEDVSLKHGCED